MTNEFNVPSKNVLLVEGLSDQHFVSQLRKKLELGIEFEIVNTGRLSKLLDAIYPQVVTGGRDVVGLLVDADREDNPSWPKINFRLTESNICVPPIPDPTGIVIPATDQRPKVGIWLMPDNQSEGELEDLVIDMIHDGDLVWPMSVKYIDQIVGKFDQKQRKFSDRKTNRAKLYAWLATCKQPPHIGAAIRAGDIDLTTDRCQSFVDWLLRLYGPK